MLVLSWATIFTVSLRCFMCVVVRLVTRNCSRQISHALSCRNIRQYKARLVVVYIHRPINLTHVTSRVSRGLFVIRSALSRSLDINRSTSLSVGKGGSESWEGGGGDLPLSPKPFFPVLVARQQIFLPRMFTKTLTSFWCLSNTKAPDFREQKQI